MGEESFVSRDQHRADLAEIRLEFKDELHGVRQDVAVLSKSVEHMQQTMQQGFSEIRREMDGLRQEVQTLRSELGQEMRAWRQSTSRQLWVMVGVVVAAVLSGLVKLVLLP